MPYNPFNKPSGEPLAAEEMRYPLPTLSDCLLETCPGISRFQMALTALDASSLKSFNSSPVARTVREP